MNLLGRYLEDGRFCGQDLDAAVDWYRRSAEGGDFRGQFSYAAVLADRGQVDTALAWLRKALVGGNLKFLRTGYKALLSAAQPEIRSFAQEFELRIFQLSDER